MTITDQIFRKVAEASIPHFFITVEFSASGTESTKQFFVEPAGVNLSIKKESGGLFSLSFLPTGW